MASYSKKPQSLLLGEGRVKFVECPEFYSSNLFGDLSKSRGIPDA
jgi:hypothetical protein